METSEIANGPSQLPIEIKPGGGTDRITPDLTLDDEVIMFEEQEGGDGIVPEKRPEDEKFPSEEEKAKDRISQQ